MREILKLEMHTMPPTTNEEVVIYIVVPRLHKEYHYMRVRAWWWLAMQSWCRLYFESLDRMNEDPAGPLKCG